MKLYIIIGYRIIRGCFKMLSIIILVDINIERYPNLLGLIHFYVFHLLVSFIYLSIQ